MAAIYGFGVNSWVDLALARRNIDAVGPAKAPYRADDRGRPDRGPANRQPAVVFGGALSGYRDQPAPSPAAPRRVDVRV